MKLHEYTYCMKHIDYMDNPDGCVQSTCRCKEVTNIIHSLNQRENYGYYVNWNEEVI